jgi:hypothetical protein
MTLRTTNEGLTYVLTRPCEFCGSETSATFCDNETGREGHAHPSCVDAANKQDEKPGGDKP